MTNFYFVYGSNMKRSRIEERVGIVVDRGIATMRDYSIAFNKQSKDGTGKTNIIPAKQKDVLGVVYELSEDQLKVLDKSEKGYFRVPMEVDLSGKIVPVQTYVAGENTINNELLPKVDYLRLLIDGVYDHNFPEDTPSVFEKL